MPAAAATPAPAAAADDLQRLGDSSALGEFLIGTLELAGWKVHRCGAFAGGVLLIATHPDGWDVETGGRALTGAAVALFERCAAIRSPEGDELVVL